MNFVLSIVHCINFFRFVIFILSMVAFSNGYAVVTNYFSLGAFAAEGEAGVFHALSLRGKGDDYSTYQVVRELISFNHESFKGIDINFLVVDYNRLFVAFFEKDCSQEGRRLRRKKYGEIELPFIKGKLAPMLIKYNVKEIFESDDGFLYVKFRRRNERQLKIALDKQEEFYEGISESQGGDDFRQEVELIKAYRDTCGEASEEYCIVDRILKSRCKLKKPKWMTTPLPLQKAALKKPVCEDDGYQEVSSSTDLSQTSDSRESKRRRIDSFLNDNESAEITGVVSSTSSYEPMTENAPCEEAGVSNEERLREVKRNETFKIFQEKYQRRLELEKVKANK